MLLITAHAQRNLYGKSLWLNSEYDDANISLLVINDASSPFHFVTFDVLTAIVDV